MCAPNWDHSASTPNIIQTPGGTYLQWVSIDFVNNITTRHQSSVSINPFQRATNNPQINPLPQSPAGQWDDRNFGSGNVVQEGDFFYLFFEGANNSVCIAGPPHNTSIWGIGFARTDTISSPASWIKFSQNPLLLAEKDDSCWMSYPEIIKIDGDYYLYYEYSLPYWQPTHHINTLFRRKIVLTCEYGTGCGSSRTCGPDDCGNQNACGSCSSSEVCNASGTCVGCTPNCSGKECGSNGCSGSCGNCLSGEICSSDGTCTAVGNEVDIDDNGEVNMADYSLFVHDYLEYRNGDNLNQRSDLNNDEKISMVDYSLFVEGYLEARGI